MSEPIRVRVPTSDGHVLDVLDGGPAGATALVFHNGTPGAPIVFPALFDAAAARDLRVILYARPGYCGSTRRPGRSVADAASDVATILDHFGIGEFLCAGWSGGGPHALACSARLGRRCAATATIAGVAPYGIAGLDFLAGMGPENVEEFTLAIEGEAALRPFVEAFAAAMADMTPADVADQLGGLISDVDRGALTGEFAEYMAASLRESVGAGVDGWLDDDLAFTKPWGFDLDDVGQVAVWQGDQDRMVPFSHGEWLAATIPGADAQLHAGEGHLSLGVAQLDRILDALAAAA